MASRSHNKSFIDQIFSKYSAQHPEKIRYRNKESIARLIDQLVYGGSEKLQIITDFDFTLTKSHINQTKCCPAADIIRQSNLMTDVFKIRARERFDKLLPIELDPNLTIEQKIPHVIESFREGFTDIVNSNKINKKSLAQLIDNVDDSFQLRDHCQTTLRYLYDAQVPVLIFSAGFGDIVEGFLRKYNLNYQNIHVVANFMEFDSDEQLIGFKEPLIHTFNKNDSVIPKNSEFIDKSAGRTNVILLGDSIGDATMAQGVHKSGTLLKIGFLNEVNDEQLEILLDHFDIVLLNDQTMDFVTCLLKEIISVAG